MLACTSEHACVHTHTHPRRHTHAHREALKFCRCAGIWHISLVVCWYSNSADSVYRGGDSCWCQHAAARVRQHAATHACGSMHRDAAEHGNLQQRNAQHRQGIQDISGRRGHQAQQVQDPGEHLERRGLARRAGGAKIYLGIKISHFRY
jgi:hypothetical protein